MARSQGKKRKAGGGYHPQAQNQKQQRSEIIPSTQVNGSVGSNHVKGGGNSGGGGGVGARNVNHVRTVSGGNSGATLSKLTLPSGFETNDNEIPSYCDYGHRSLGGGTKFSMFRNSKMSSRGKTFDLKTEVISSNVDNSPELRRLEDGYDLEKELKPWCCFGKNSWQGRHFAHGFSSNFSSPVIAAGGHMLGKADFISDWLNIKTLIKSHSSDSHLSYLIHRVGDSMTIDHLDLTGLILFPGFLEFSPEFRKFILDVLGDDKHKIMTEGKSKRSILSKEAYHQLLHRSMKTPLIPNKAKQASSNSSQSRANINVGENDEFLHSVLVRTSAYRILVGSNLPTFSEKSPLGVDQVTVRANFEGRRPDDEFMNDMVDLWLDNNLMQCPKSLVTHLKNDIVSKTEWMYTDNLPVMGKFDPMNYLGNLENLLNFIQEHVKSGSSYWLYRAPGSIDIKLYNLSNIALRKEDGSGSHIFDNWKYLDPYLPYFTVASLSKYAELISESIPESFKVEPVSWSLNSKTDGKSVNKVQKLGTKLESLLRTLQTRLKNGCNWLIQSLEGFHDFRLIVGCLKGIYDTACKLVPSSANRLRKAGVDRFLLMCLKLRKILGDKLESRGPNTGVAQDEEELKNGIISFGQGVCNVLSLLKGWYDKINTDQFGDEERNEWTYTGCRLHLLYADTLTIIVDQNFNMGNMSLFRRLDQDVPSGAELKEIADLLESAIRLIPKSSAVKVKHHLFLPVITEKADPSQSLNMTDLQNEVYQKAAYALLRLVSHKMVFPTYLSHDFDSEGNDECDSSSGASPWSTMIQKSKEVIKESYKDLLGTIEKCMEYLKKVDDPVQVRFRANGLKARIAEIIFSLENPGVSHKAVLKKLALFTDSEFLLTPNQDDLFTGKFSAHLDEVAFYPFKEEFLLGENFTTSLNGPKKEVGNETNLSALAVACESSREIKRMFKQYNGTLNCFSRKSGMKGDG